MIKVFQDFREPEPHDYPEYETAGRVVVFGKQPEDKREHDYRIELRKCVESEITAPHGFGPIPVDQAKEPQRYQQGKKPHVAGLPVDAICDYC